MPGHCKGKDKTLSVAIADTIYPFAVKTERIVSIGCNVGKIYLHPLSRSVGAFYVLEGTFCAYYLIPLRLTGGKEIAEESKNI